MRTVDDIQYFHKAIELVDSKELITDVSAPVSVEWSGFVCWIQSKWIVVEYKRSRIGLIFVLIVFF